MAARDIRVPVRDRLLSLSVFSVWRLVSSGVLTIGLTIGMAAGIPKEVEKQDQRVLQLEEGEDYFAKWLDEDVIHIITKPERAVFERLQTEEEKQRFIEQFWLRRDTDSATAINEFKEEHYRRLAYANEKFGYAGKPGWMMDRGMIYIKYGPPDSIESHSMGGYTRELWEGGGHTVTFPFERWRYRYIVGIGSDTEIEFVDPTFSGEFRFAENSEEKDAFLWVPTLGMTKAEELGVATRADRIRDVDLQHPKAYLLHRRLKDMPFERLYQLAYLEAPPAIKYRDLQNIVTANIRYDQLPFRYRLDTMLLDNANWVVFLTVSVPNKELQYERLNSLQRARAKFYAAVTNLTGRILAEFDDTVTAGYTQEDFPKRAWQRSHYQKSFFLPSGLYKLNMVIQDVLANKVGTVQTRIAVPKLVEKNLTLSSVMLSRWFKLLDRPANRLEPFVMGDLKIVPSVDGRFKQQDPLVVYLQVYGAQLDQASLQPHLDIEYKITENTRPVFSIDDDQGKSVRHISSRRIELLKLLSLTELPPAQYQLEVEVSDHLSRNRATAHAPFEVKRSN